MVAESGTRSALRFHKTAPYRKVERLEREVQKKTVNHNYHRAVAENPKLQSNMLSRAAQKRKVRKEYAKAARQAKKTAGQAKKAGSAVEKAGKATAGFVKRHPAITGAIVAIGLSIWALMAPAPASAAGGAENYPLNSIVIKIEDIVTHQIS